MSERLADDRQTGGAPPNLGPGPGREPVKRQGPRPLALHLTAALGSLLSSSAALPLLRNGSLPWAPALRDRAAALRGDMVRADRLRSAAPDADRLTQQVDREIRRRIDAVLTGIERYRSHPYRRDLQKEYVQSLIELMNPPQPVMPANLPRGLILIFGGDIKNTDIPSIARAHLVTLRKRILAAVPLTADKLSKYHLQDVAERIKQALEPK